MGMGNLANDSIREVSKDHVDQREQLETVQKVPATLMNLPQEYVHQVIYTTPATKCCLFLRRRGDFMFNPFYVLGANLQFISYWLI